MTTLTILGCSGGLGKNEFTTSFLLDSETLIDAGTGVGTLTQSELKKITTVFLTHAHLDHICGLPLLVDNLYGTFTRPLQVYASSSVIAALRQHIFNWKIWPDFSQLPSSETPCLQFIALEPGQTVNTGPFEVTAFSVPHVVPAQGYRVRNATATFAYAADTGFNVSLIETLNNLGPINHLLLECAWPNAESERADVSGHLTPELVKQVIDALDHAPETVTITHLKPTQADLIRAQLGSLINNFDVAKTGDRYEF